MTKTRSVTGIVLRFAALLFMVYIVYTLIATQIQITNKTEQLSQLQSEVLVQKAKNDELTYRIANECDSLDSYAEEYARSELGYAKQGERVFVNGGGN